MSNRWKYCKSLRLTFFKWQRIRQNIMCLRTCCRSSGKSIRCYLVGGVHSGCVIPPSREELEVAFQEKWIWLYNWLCFQLFRYRPRQHVKKFFSNCMTWQYHGGRETMILTNAYVLLHFKFVDYKLQNNTRVFGNFCQNMKFKHF